MVSVLGHNGCLLPVKPLHQMCVQLLDFSYLTRDPIYSTLLEMAIENSTPSQLQVAKFLAVKEDSMLLAVGIISTSVFILEPRHWAQVQLWLCRALRTCCVLLGEAQGGDICQGFR